MGESYVAAGGRRAARDLPALLPDLPTGGATCSPRGSRRRSTYLEQLRFTAADLAVSRVDRPFRRGASRAARAPSLRLPRCGRCREGTVFFPHEPVLEVRGPLLEAQIVETALISDRPPVDVDGLPGRAVRRGGAGAAGWSSSGCAARTAARRGSRSRARASSPASPRRATCSRGSVTASRSPGRWRTPTSRRSRTSARRSSAFTRSYPDGSTLLIDTYDTVEGARRAAAVAQELAGRGGRLGAVRLDSGDLLELSRRCARCSTRPGSPTSRSSRPATSTRPPSRSSSPAGAPIDAFGIGTRLSTAAGAPSFDLVYKLVELDGHGVMKLSTGKATLPGSKQVWRRPERPFAGDVVALADEAPPDGRRAAARAGTRRWLTCAARDARRRRGRWRRGSWRRAAARAPTQWRSARASRGSGAGSRQGSAGEARDCGLLERRDQAARARPRPAPGTARPIRAPRARAGRTPTSGRAARATRTRARRRAPRGERCAAADLHRLVQERRAPRARSAAPRGSGPAPRRGGRAPTSSRASAAAPRASSSRERRLQVAAARRG